jgi:hypothetical protein
VVRLRLIGQMEAWTVRSESVLPAGRKTRALLAYVAMAAPRLVLRGRLAEQLWSRRPEEQARASLRQEIHRLLDALSPAEAEILVVTRDHLALRPGAVWVDVEEVMPPPPVSRRRWRCWTGTCWRTWTGSIRISTPGCTPNASGCATAAAASPRRC